MAPDHTSPMIGLLQPVHRLLRGLAYRRRQPAAGEVLESRKQFFEEFKDLLAGQHARQRGSAALIYVHVRELERVAVRDVVERILEPLEERDLKVQLPRGHFFVGLSGVSDPEASRALRRIGDSLVRGPLKEGEFDLGLAHFEGELPSAAEFLRVARKNGRAYRRSSRGSPLAGVLPALITLFARLLPLVWRRG